MLEIDYNLFPLSDEEQAQIRVHAVALAKRGKPPPLTAASHGRVVVVNPYDGYNLHHVPDDLRRPLRRAMVPVTEANRPLTGAELARGILEKTQEPVYQIVVELYSNFPHAVSFLREISGIQRRYPLCNVIVHGEMRRTHDLLKEILAEKGASCDLLFDHFDGAITLRSSEQLDNLVVELPRYPTLATPFFSHIRINHADKAITFAFDELRRLYRQFGVGHIDELDLSGKLREKLIVLDLPLTSIESVRLAPPGTDGLTGINIDGEKVTPSDFAAKGLLERDIPLSSVSMIYRQPRGQAEEEVRLDEVRALRVNCIEGNVSFLWKPTARYIPLYEVRAMRLDLGEPATKDGSRASLGAELGDRVLTVDNAVITERGQPRFGDIRAGIRHKYLEHMFQESLGRQVKLQRYASRLKIGCLGPMAAQTIKLLRPYGLGQLIPLDSLYYLCDTVEQIPEYFESSRRVQTIFDEVVKTLKGVFGESREGEFHSELINHRLPIVQEWARGEAPPLKKVTSEHLDTIYKELRVFLGFAESEFRRIKAGDTTGNLVFDKVERCQEALLQVGHLANLIGGRYGKLPDRQSFPDFVFFSSESEIQDNRKEYYLPGLALSGVFNNKETQQLFHANDFEFSVFLEEQLSMMAYLKSQDFDEQSDEDFYERYFAEKAAESQNELAALQQTTEVLQHPASDSYEQAVDRMTEQHQAEVVAFRNDRDLQAGKLETQETNYFMALKAVNDYLGDAEITAEHVDSGEDYIRAMDQQLMDKSKELLDKFNQLVKENVAGSNELMEQKKKNLTAYLLAFSKMQKTLFAHLQADYGVSLRERYHAELPQLLEQLNNIARVPSGEVEAVGRNLEKRLLLFREELAEIDEKANRGVAENQKTMVAIREANRRLVAKLAKPLTGEPTGYDTLEVLRLVEERLEFVKQEIGKIAAAAEVGYGAVENLRALYRSKSEKALAIHFGDNERQMLEERQGRSRLQRMMAKKVDQPLLPPPAFGPPESAATIAGQLEACIQAWREGEEELRNFEFEGLNPEETRGVLEGYDAFQEVCRNFRRAVRQKVTTQQAVVNITERLERLDKEAANLPDYIRQHMLPAQASYVERIHIPNIRKRMAHLKQTWLFVRALKELSFADLQREFLDRAIFRRFYASQFCTGAYFGMNSELPIFAKLSNVSDALSLFYRGLRSGLTDFGYKSQDLTLTRLPAERPQGILKFIEGQKQLPPNRRLTYLVLPSTLSLSQALEIIHYKEAYYNGLPQLVLLFISKFDAAQLAGDEGLRDRYFAAMKHNVIVNIDDDRVVDNPKAIADRLIQDTLGCSHDIQETDPASTGDEAAQGRTA